MLFCHLIAFCGKHYYVPFTIENECFIICPTLTIRSKGIMRKNEKELIAKAYEFAKQQHQGEKSGHDFEHIKRVFANAKTLLRKEPRADKFIVEMSALLHDIDDRKLNPGGNKAEMFLRELGLDEKAVNTIIETIASIDFATTGSHPRLKTIEMKLLFDSDKLDAIGAIGICRAVLFGSWVQRPLFEADCFPKKDLTAEEYKDLNRKENNSINHFFDKLLKLKNAMQTETGRTEAQKRHKTMVKFLYEFFREQGLREWIAYLTAFEQENQ